MSTPETPSPENAPPPTSEPAPAPATKLDDANDLRGHHLKRLMRKKTTWALVLGLTIVAGAAFAVLASPAAGGIAAGIVAVISLLVVFFMADSAAGDDFFEFYAQQRGMIASSDRGRLPGATPLLRKGDDRYTERSLLGPLAEGIEGTVALYTYEEETRDSKGNKQTSYYHYTVGLVEVPECAARIPELYCQRKFGFRALEKFEDVFRGSKDRVKLESEVLDDKYEIFADEKQDANWLRQLFSPTFIVWLTDSAPEKFAFELVDGTLCCYVNGHKESTAELDEIRAASAAVVTRLREEAAE